MDDNIRESFELKCKDINIKYDFALVGGQYKNIETHQAFCLYAVTLSESQKEIERLRAGIHEAWKNIVNIDDDTADILCDLLPDN